MGQGKGEKGKGHGTKETGSGKGIQAALEVALPLIFGYEPELIPWYLAFVTPVVGCVMYLPCVCFGVSRARGVANWSDLLSIVRDRSFKSFLLDVVAYFFFVAGAVASVLYLVIDTWLIAPHPVLRHLRPVFTPLVKKMAWAGWLGWWTAGWAGWLGWLAGWAGLAGLAGWAGWAIWLQSYIV